MLVAFLVAGAAFRIGWNDVAEYSPADESHYFEYARYLHDAGWNSYPSLVRHHIRAESSWEYPSPLRWGYLSLGAAAYSLCRECGHRGLAWVSTAAGVAVVFLTYVLGLELLGARPALLGAGLTVASPLQLALGRRALPDEVFCAVALAALWAWLRALRSGEGEGRGWRYTLAVVLSTLGFAVKESFVTLYPAFLVLALFRVRERGFRLVDAVLFLAPPLLFVLEFCLLTGSVSDFVTLVRIMGSTHIDYVAFYQAGPPHRPLFDLLLLAPLVCLTAAGAVGIVLSRSMDSGPGARGLTAITLVTLVVYAFLSKNVRFVVMVDPWIRLLAAWMVVKHQLEPRKLGLTWIAGVAAVNAAVEIPIFRAIFITGAVYDPVSANLLRALKVIP